MDPNKNNRKLINKLGRKELLELRKKETFQRKTLSFYRYISIENPEVFRNTLFQQWDALGCLGRIYVAREGINAQMNVPEPNFSQFLDTLEKSPELNGISINIAVAEERESFLKLSIKVKHQIVADGLQFGEYDISNVGNHLSPEKWNIEMERGDSIVIDMRNHYESEIGHFDKAYLPKDVTFKNAIRSVSKDFEASKDKKILLYCTGGIRCEKASAYLKSNGFKNVNQLYGGIINYSHEIKRKGLPNKFKGKNFVFDHRLGERISPEVISHCHQCGKPCDVHANCGNKPCNLLFIQCDACKETHQGCCSKACVSKIKAHRKLV